MPEPGSSLRGRRARASTGAGPRTLPPPGGPRDDSASANPVNCRDSRVDRSAVDARAVNQPRLMGDHGGRFHDGSVRLRACACVAATVSTCGRLTALMRHRTTEAPEATPSQNNVTCGPPVPVGGAGAEIRFRASGLRAVRRDAERDSRQRRLDHRSGHLGPAAPVRARPSNRTPAASRFRRRPESPPRRRRRSGPAGSPRGRWTW